MSHNKYGAYNSGSTDYPKFRIQLFKSLSYSQLKKNETTLNAFIHIIELLMAEKTFI